MDAAIRRVVVECTRDSAANTSRFPEIVARLSHAGVERYHADLVRAEKTYYLPSGESEVVPDPALRLTPALDFVPASVDAAVRASQAGSIDYPEFCRRIAAAGCTGYFVSISGRRALYYGRTGETHVEPFPGTR